MPKIKLTKSAVDTLRSTSRDEAYWNSTLPGFGVKVTPKGRKVFIALYRVRGGNRDCASTPSVPTASSPCIMRERPLSACLPSALKAAIQQPRSLSSDAGKWSIAWMT